MKSIAERLNVNQEDTEVLHALIHFCISTSSHFLTFTPKIKEIEETQNKILKDADKLKLSNNMLEIDIKRRLITFYVKQILVLPKSKVSIDEFEDESQIAQIKKKVEGELINKIMLGDTKLVSEIIEEVMNKLQMKQDMKNYFKAL